MEVYYLTADSKSDTLRVYRDPETNTHQLDRETAEKVARNIAATGGFARVIFGGTVVEEHGNDPRHLK